MPPHSTVCSPNRSVSHSSLNVVSMIPERPPPIAAGVGRREVVRVAGRILVDRDRTARAPPSYSLRTVWPGPFGAIISHVGARLDQAEVDVEPVPNTSARAGFMLAVEVVVDRWLSYSSGARIMSMSAHWALGTGHALSSAPRAFLPSGAGRRAMRDLLDAESRRFCAWAWPWLP